MRRPSLFLVRVVFLPALLGVGGLAVRGARSQPANQAAAPEAIGTAFS